MPQPFYLEANYTHAGCFYVLWDIPAVQAYFERVEAMRRVFLTPLVVVRDAPKDAQ